jgi:hypothetical protein
MARSPDFSREKPFTPEQLSEIPRNFAMLSRSSLQKAYSEALERCRLTRNGRPSNAAHGSGVYPWKKVVSLPAQFTRLDSRVPRVPPGELRDLRGLMRARLAMHSPYDGIEEPDSCGSETLRDLGLGADQRSVSPKSNAYACRWRSGGYRKRRAVPRYRNGNNWMRWDGTSGSWRCASGNELAVSAGF